jgi:hypothetical protein
VKPKIKEVMDLTQKIRDIENEIDELNEQKARCEWRLEQLVISDPTPVSSTSASGETPRRGRIASEGSARTRITNLLNEQPTVDFDADVVAKQLNIPIGTVRSNLSRLKGDGAIEKRPSNKYGAVTTKQKEATEAAS